ncbi:Flagellar motility protein MotE, a chaperone for MotC folding [Methylobacterium gossipiicola]|uniref:Flagellar motility protein MotE, a chaperone for MotC folding n=1 Tax=Methylobacterium gossipiicola TaxID=582675 RepID=A0A1I2THV4_9HYPH|nr:Flagellar motility protein MotE, a chaperone for MotC folding [Methylobacterium gossipiicola]
MTQPVSPPTSDLVKIPAPLEKMGLRVRFPQPRPLKLRLIDGVTLAAAGLLVLKLASIAIEDSKPVPGAPLPEFARVLAKARTGYEPSDPATTGSVTPKEPEKAPSEPKKPAARPPSPQEAMSATERAILERLANRRDTLKQRSEALDMREQLIGTAERKLENGVDALKQEEGKIESGTTERAEAEKAAFKNIVTMYETMKPKDAARVFDRLNQDVLVPIVLTMNPRKMAEVLALMQSEPAEKLTVALANRAQNKTPTLQIPSIAGLGPSELPAIEMLKPPSKR